ncbi:hypothetical protein R1flu_008977 [Riccia fluitans]|uniref:Uncharacterized protein n=1 Tax=Riccia fluitans TaxID=41844 RepID=A0ABD1Z1M1_9MARC
MVVKATSVVTEFLTRVVDVWNYFLRILLILTHRQRATSELIADRSRRGAENDFEKMENILPNPFRRHHKDEEEYSRHGKHGHRPGYNPYEYTGQPIGFEHMGSPPKHTDMDVNTIAQLGYEGPEGERRKVEAINEQIYGGVYDGRRHREYSPPRGSNHGSHHHSSSSSHHGSSHHHHRGEEYEREYPPREREYPPRPVYRSAEYPDGVPEGYMLDKDGHLKYVGDTGFDKHNKSHHHHRKSRDSDSDDDGYAGKDERYRRRYAGDNPIGEEYSDAEYRRRYGRERSPVVKVERKVEEDGTVVERIYPANSGGSTYGRHDPHKIHYGRQDSFTDDVPVVGPYRQDSYPGNYAQPYNPATSSYGRRYDSGSSDYVEERDRRY